MTKKEAHIQFKVILDKNAQGVAYGGSPAFLMQEVDIFLDQAINQVITNKITGHNDLQLGFEEGFRRISELDSLVSTDVCIASNTSNNEFVIDNIHNNGNRMILYQFVLEYGLRLAPCDIVSHKYANNYKVAYNNIPYVNKPIVTIEDNKALIYVDPILMTKVEYAPTAGKYNVQVSYIRKPKLMSEYSLDDVLELPDQLLQEVINRAVVLALENIESQRVSTKAQLNQIQE